MKHITPEKRREIFQAWKMYGKQRAVALAAGVDRKTADRWKPDRRQPMFTAQGYSTWSEPARRRWDEFWSQPLCVSQIFDLLHLRGEREDL